MTQATPDPLPPGSLLGGRYRVERAIASTTTGAVYAAVDTRDQRPVALKAIWPAYLDAVGDSLLQRFVREAHVSAALPNPHIVPALGGAFDPETRIPYVVMPLLLGRDLGRWLDEIAPLPPVVAVRIALQAAQGLRLAHDYGIVHRDIKPSNLFLEEREGGRIVVRVSDFGVAKIKPVDEQHITRTGNLLGSPVYMSPEQLIRPRDVDGRADVWSLAMTLYHALAGQAPLAAVKSFTDLVLTLSQQDIPSLQQAAPWVDPALARVVHGALLRTLDARCPSMDALIDA
ncbi:MAG: serine/threonine protein kinase, partial [Myxococcales bacterium]